MSFNLLSRSATFPITTAEIKSQLRVTGITEDVLIDRYVVAATIQAENFMDRVVVSSSWEYRTHSLTSPMVIKLLGITSITKVEYYDGDNVLTTLPVADYIVDLNHKPPLIKVVDGKTWPTVYPRTDAVVVTFDAGYATAADVPEDLKQGIIITAARMYEKREDEIKKFPSASEVMFFNYKLHEHA